MTTRRRSSGHELIRTLALWLAIAVGIALVVVIAGWRPRVEYVLALAGVGAVATVALRRLGATMVEAMWPSAFPPRPVDPGVDQRINSLETLLRRSVEDPVTYQRRLRPLLEDLAAHRLRRNHGIELATDPDAARRLLGDAAWALMTDTGDRPVAASGLERAVAAIERL